MVYAPISEPFGLSPLEAMACGTPVVGVNEGGVSETVIDGSTGKLVSRKATEFAKAIETLWSDSKLRRAYGSKARKYVKENWTWDKSVSNLENHLIACSKLSINK